MYVAVDSGDNAFQVKDPELKIKIGIQENAMSHKLSPCDI